MNRWPSSWTDLESRWAGKEQREMAAALWNRAIDDGWIYESDLRDLGYLVLAVAVASNAARKVTVAHVAEAIHYRSIRDLEMTVAAGKRADDVMDAYRIVLNEQGEAR